MLHLALLALLFVGAQCGPIPDEDWGYVTINKEYGANMFWYWDFGFFPEIPQVALWSAGGR